MQNLFFLFYSLKPKSLECMIVFVDDAISAQIHSIWTKSLSLTHFFSTCISTSINITFLTCLLSFHFIFIFIGIEAFKFIRIQAIRFSPEGRVEILHFLSQRILCWNSNLEVIYLPFHFDFIFLLNFTNVGIFFTFFEEPSFLSSFRFSFVYFISSCIYELLLSCRILFRLILLCFVLSCSVLSFLVLFDSE